MSQSSNAVFITGRLDETFIALLQYTLLGFTYRAFDSGGESGRTMRAHTLETVLLNTPQTIKQHPMAKRMRQAIEADVGKFISLSREIFLLPRMGDELNPDEDEGFSKSDRKKKAFNAFKEMCEWLHNLRTTD